MGDGSIVTTLHHHPSALVGPRRPSSDRNRRSGIATSTRPAQWTTRWTGTGRGQGPPTVSSPPHKRRACGPGHARWDLFARPTGRLRAPPPRGPGPARRAGGRRHAAHRVHDRAAGPSGRRRVPRPAAAARGGRHRVEPGDPGARRGHPGADLHAQRRRLRGACSSTSTAAAGSSATSRPWTGRAGRSPTPPTSPWCRSTTGSRPSTCSPRRSTTATRPPRGSPSTPRSSASTRRASRSAATRPAATSPPR